jgi:enterochelin esterase-like enzyme
VRWNAVAVLVLVTSACSGTQEAAPRTGASVVGPSVTSPVTSSVSSSPVAQTIGSIGSTAAPDCAGAGIVEPVDTPFGPQGAQRANVYLPACYASEPDRRFPVVFLLHGAGADASQWPAIGIASVADQLITRGAIPPMIVVMPDGGVNMPDALASDLVDQLVPWTDHTYRTLADAADRAVGGISRGGRIALLAASKHPGVFSCVGGHSPLVGAGDDAVAARLSAQDEPIRLDVGASDSLRTGVEHFAHRVEDGGGSADLVEAPGRHDRAYWRAHTSDYLRFYASLLS